MSAFWVYTLARLGVLLAAFGLLYAAGARGLLLIVLAFVVSMLVSYWLLAGLRDRFTAGSRRGPHASPTGWTRPPAPRTTTPTSSRGPNLSPRTTGSTQQGAPTR